MTAVIRRAVAEHENLELFIVDTSPYHPGRAQQDQLSRHGIPCNLVKLSCASYWIEHVCVPACAEEQWCVRVCTCLRSGPYRLAMGRWGEGGGDMREEKCCYVLLREHLCLSS